jgi:uncharacterized membrane protein
MAAALAVVGLLMIATERPASAYIDPGSGAVIWQSALALLAGVGFFFRKINFWFKNRKGRKVE